MQKVGRRNRAYIGGNITNVIHLRRPFVVALCTFLFPGFGQVKVCKYLTGCLLIVWEVLINVGSNLNTAIVYTFTGRFEAAKQVLDPRLALLYLPVFGYAFWDSYRSTVEINKAYLLADQEDAAIRPFYIGPLELNLLEKRNPRDAALWSLLIPGIGHIFTQRLPTGFFMMGWWIVFVYLSHAGEALLYTASGHFQEAVQVLDPKWALFLPSMYGLSMYDGYVTTVEYNKVFEKELSHYLRTNYQSPVFPLLPKP